MAEETNFKSTVESLFKGMDGVISSKTVVGDAIHINDTIILPLVDVPFGIGAGSFLGDKKEKGMGGIGRKSHAQRGDCHSRRKDPTCKY